MRRFVNKYTVSAVAVLILLAFAVRFWPRARLADTIHYSQAVYAVDGSLMRLTMAADETFRLFTPLGDISPSLVDATLFYEDRYFRYHPGVNPVALFRGFWTTYVKKQRAIGGSTITMQLARVVYDIDSSNIPGKIKQIFAALWIEARYSKNDIIEAYLNAAPYGHNIEGVGAASLIYFNKRAADLSLMEGMTLAVIPQNPVKRLPTSNSGWTELKRQRDQLMAAWVKAYPADMEKLAHFELPMHIYRIGELPYLAPHFVDGILTADPGRGEYFTTLDLQKQRILEGKIKEFTAERAYLGIYNAAALLINTDSMEVEAAVGSADFFSDEIFGQVDGTRAMRSPGSLIKPFIYGLAIDSGLIHPGTLLKDAPRRFGLYSPENADRTFMGPIHAQEALVTSRNIPAVDLMLQLEKGSVVGLLAKSGVKGLKDDDYYGAALALGGFEISMEDAARIYASLNNFGQIQALKKLQGEENSDAVQIFSQEAAYITRDMLRHNPPLRIYGSRAKLDTPVAWKTGTSFRFRDGWAALVFDKYVLVVWVGNFDSFGNPAFMARYSAAPLAFRILHDLLAVTKLAPPEADEIPYGLNVKKVDICELTGELPLDYCPQITQTLFIPGVSPIKTSDVFLRIPVDKETGLRACSYDPETTIWEVYEFWPADILELYELAGVKRKIPPRYMPNCTIEDTFTGIPPSILYPQSNVIYDMQASPGEEDGLPLIAAAGADADTIYWFVDNMFIGSAENGKPLFWKAERGKHYLQAVDNLGRTTSLIFEVM